MIFLVPFPWAFFPKDLWVAAPVAESNHKVGLSWGLWCDWKPQPNRSEIFSPFLLGLESPVRSNPTVIIYFVVKSNVLPSSRPRPRSEKSTTPGIPTRWKIHIALTSNCSLDCIDKPFQHVIGLCLRLVVYKLSITKTFSYRIPIVVITKTNHLLPLVPLFRLKIPLIKIPSEKSWTRTSILTRSTKDLLKKNGILA